VHFLICIPAEAAEQLPSATNVLQRIIERAAAVAQAEKGPRYTYEKHSLLEYLDENGKTTKTEERFYQVRLVAGFPFDRLIKIQGRELTDAELKKEREKEEQFQQKVSSRNVKKMAARKEGWVTSQLMDRYQFTVKERILLNNRPTLVIEFKPKHGKLPVKNFMDKILNQLAGTTWIDETDADAAKLSVTLQDSVSLGLFGVLGSLNQCEFTLERQRMADGTWINVKQVVFVHYRKLATTARFRNTEKSSGIKNEEMSR
jgi:hypothetical protein